MNRQKERRPASGQSMGGTPTPPSTANIPRAFTYGKVYGAHVLLRIVRWNLAEKLEARRRNIDSTRELTIAAAHSKTAMEALTRLNDVEGLWP